jgi:hypothetical protein
MNSIACLNNCESEEAVATDQYAPEISIEKVLTIKRQLGEGTYYVAEKLDVVIDKILEELLNQ